MYAGIQPPAADHIFGYVNPIQRRCIVQLCCTCALITSPLIYPQATWLVLGLTRSAQSCMGCTETPTPSRRESWIMDNLVQVAQQAAASLCLYLQLNSTQLNALAPSCGALAAPAVCLSVLLPPSRPSGMYVQHLDLITGFGSNTNAAATQGMVDAQQPGAQPLLHLPATQLSPSHRNLAAVQLGLSRFSTTD